MSFQILEDTCDFLSDQINGAEAKAVYENSRLILAELACRLPENGMQRGYGCDGIDNTCDIDKQIDECAEDVFPPEFFVSSYPSGYYESAGAALEYLRASVSATDDCKTVDTTIVDISNNTPCSAKFRATAVAGVCGSPVHDTSIMEFNAKVDGVPPGITCSIEEQNLTGSGRGDYVNVGFGFEASDECTSKLDVEIIVQSDEILDKDNEHPMVILSDGDKPKLYVQDDYCHGEKHYNCNIGTDLYSRLYKVTVKVTDEAGNTGVCICSTDVVKPPYSKKSKKTHSGKSKSSKGKGKGKGSIVYIDQTPTGETLFTVATKSYTIE